MDTEPLYYNESKHSEPASEGQSQTATYVGCPPDPGGGGGRGAGRDSERNYFDKMRAGTAPPSGGMETDTPEVKYNVDACASGPGASGSGSLRGQQPGAPPAAHLHHPQHSQHHHHRHPHHLSPSSLPHPHPHHHQQQQPGSLPHHPHSQHTSLQPPPPPSSSSSSSSSTSPSSHLPSASTDVGYPGNASSGSGWPPHYQYGAMLPGGVYCKQEEEMSLWSKAQQLQGEPLRQVRSVYGVHFPLEVRHFFAQWIETQPWHDIDLDNQDHEYIASQMRDNLLRMLDEKVGELNSDDMFLVKVKLQETSQQFREMYTDNPMNFVRVVRNCIATEQRLVQQAERAAGDSGQANLHRQISSTFDYLTQVTQETEIDLRQLQQKQESFIIQYQENVKINSELTHLQNQLNGQTQMETQTRIEQLKGQKHAVEAQLASKAAELLELRISLQDKHHETFKKLDQIRRLILDEQLIGWKRQQQLAGNGAPFEASLEMLQQWCESLAELIWQNRQQVAKLQPLYEQLPINMPPGRQDMLHRLQTTITNLLSSIVTSTFIIEKQPPQVLKKDSRFTATVRLLVGGKLNVHMNPPSVKATILSEEQARNLMKNVKDMKNECSGDILNNTGTMEYHQASGQLGVTFRNMQLKRIRRAEKKGNEVVTEEKFSILFQSRFTVGSGELVFEVWTLSLPVVVTVHGNQECNALATVLWDNAFSEPGRIPFVVPDRVVWSQLASALNTKFASSCGLGLTDDSVHYLATKLFGQGDDFTNHPVSWSQFNREPLQNRNFTFWEWFYSIVKLTKDWLAGPWKQRLILGFVSKQDAQDLLMRCAPGTFLLRFSDSEIGGITIAWVAADTKNPTQLTTWNLAPFTDKDFKIRGLGDRIKDLSNLTMLYPDTPKQVAFEKFWTQVPDPSLVATNPGYVKPELNTVIPGMTNEPPPTLNYDDPRIPQKMNPQSPASTYGGSVGGPSGADSASGMETPMERDDMIPDFNLDYNPEDIDHINVNDFLANYRPDQ